MAEKDPLFGRVDIFQTGSNTKEGTRKTTLSILLESMLTEVFSGLQNEEAEQFNLPALVTEIAGPAVIVIPVAIYA